MELIIITGDTFFDGESAALNLLFTRGLQRLHIRKPGSTPQACTALIEQIDPTFYSRIVLHEHYQLASDCKLRGIHLNTRNTNAPTSCEGLTISRSCHAVDELIECNNCDYCFLSPIFDSVSKTGYGGKFSPEELIQAKNKLIINHRVIALGGITPQRIETAMRYGFGGVALIGALWQNFSVDLNTNELLMRFDELQSQCRRR